MEMSHERMCLFNEGESRIYEHSHLWIFSGGAFHDELVIGFLEDSSATCYLASSSGCSLSVDSGLHGGKREDTAICDPLVRDDGLTTILVW